MPDFTCIKCLGFYGGVTVENIKKHARECRGPAGGGIPPGKAEITLKPDRPDHRVPVPVQGKRRESPAGMNSHEGCPDGRQPPQGPKKPREGLMRWLD